MLRLYVFGICILALILAIAQDWGGFARLASGEFHGLVTLSLLALFTEQQSLSIGKGRASGGTSIGFLPLFTVLVLFGPAGAVAVMVLNGPVVEYLIRRKRPLRANFNVGQYVAAAGLGGLVFAASGGVPLLALPESSRSAGILDQMGPFILFGVVVLVFNNAAVAMAIALSERLSFRNVWDAVVAQTGVSIVTDLLVAPVAIAVAALYIQIGTVGLVLAILPLLFIRHSYLTTFRLKKANRDLLKALVKAIETRDPYTSGHSVRVSKLASAIAELRGLPRRQVSEIETAALLHDIGKIEGVYSEILKKPSSLSVEERRMIESHVTRGAELISSLTSFGDEVRLPVLHHHEHVDGTGYPKGLEGPAIPLGARIIKLCDAIDAMLSDRPYRRALPLHQVYAQLRLYSGRQFDADLVESVLDTDLVACHVEGVTAEEVSDWSLSNPDAIQPVGDPTPIEVPSISETRRRRAQSGTLGWHH